MTTRKKISSDIETEVLYKSGRRCCLCFGLNNDFCEKPGQIAHLDRNNCNSKLENLAFLCLEHHDKYDTRTSQSKGWTIGEAKKYINDLHLAVEKWRKNSQYYQDMENSIKELKPASDNEILILIADFFNASKNVNYDVTGSILESLNTSLNKSNFNDVRIESVKEVFRRNEFEVMKAVGKSYNATAFIWGHYDDGGIFPRYTILQKDKLIIPNEIPARFVNLMHPPDDFPIYIHHYLPFQFTYLVQFTIGQIYFWKNEFKSSRFFLEDALKCMKSVNNEEIKESLANLYFYLGFVNIALNEKYEFIEQAFSKGIESGNSHPVGYFNRAVANIQMGNTTQALSDFSTAIELDGSCSHAYYGRGITYTELNKLDLAVLDFTQAIDIDKNFIDAYYNRGNAYRLLEEAEKAILDYTKVIELNDGYINAYYNRGIVYSDLSNLRQALEDYNIVIQLNIKYVLVYNSRGNLYKKIGDEKAAFEDYKQAIEIDPQYDMPHYNLGILYVKFGEIEKGIAEYNIAIQINSTYSKAYYNRGNAYFLLNKLDNALSDYSKSIELEPEYTGAYVNRGNIYKTMGCFNEAILDYEKAIELDPSLAPAYFNRAYTYLHLKQLNQAISDFHKLLELAPDTHNKQNIIDLINSLNIDGLASSNF
ncbi:tetratricopeptide repeat protein [Nostoc sp. DSM 114159]|jgi:tetratricopeptide (TPR) repeat protein